MTQNNSQFDPYDIEFDDSPDLLQKRVKYNSYTAPEELIQETSMSGDLTDPFEKPDLTSSQKKSTYQPKKKVRVLSPPRHDSFQESDATPKEGMRTYAEILLARKLENEQIDLQAKVARVQREQAQIAKSYTKQEKTVPQVPLASTAESSISEWEKDEPSLKAQKANYAKPEAKASRWDQVEDTPSRFSSRGFAFTETPTPRRLGKSRWDETPNVGGYQTPNRLGGETPTMTGKRGWETPTAGQFRDMEALTPGRIQQLVMERQADERNRPWTQEELDQLLPSAGFEVVKAPQDYQPPRAFDSNLTPSSYYQIPASAGRPYEVPCTPSQGNEAIPNINPEDLGYFGALLNPVIEENLTIEEQKERKVMTLLLKIKNGTPPMRKSALRQITEKARELGAEHLFNQILPLLMSPTLQDKERHLFVKVIDRVLYKLDDLVRPYVHKILNVIEPLLIDQDYYARIEAREIISNLAKSAGLASMISAMRPDIDHHDEYVRNTTARAFAVVASALGIPTLLPFLKAVCQSKKSWQARHTGIRIVQQIAILMGCSVLPHLSSLVNIIASGLDKNENQKIRILTALTVAALAEAASPYGIEAFEEVIEPLWKDAERTSPKNLAAILKAMGSLIPLMENEDAGEYVDKICPLVVKQFDSADEEMKVIILKVLKQCVSTEGVKSSYIRENILSPFLKNFWMRKSALNSRSYKHVVETTVEIAKKVGGAEIIQEIVGYLKDSNEMFRKMTLETIQNIVISLGAADITYHAEKRLMDGLLCAFHEQTFGDNSPVMLNGFAAIVNVLNQRAKPYFPQICGIIQWRLNNKSARVRQQAADLISRIALVMKNCGEETKLGKLGVMLYESLGEEYPEVLGSILGGLKAIVNVIGMNNMTPPIKDLLPRLTPILKNRHEKVQENCIDLVGRIADRGAEYVSAKEWMRICFDLLDLLNAHKKGIRRAAINTFGYIASAIGPQDVLCTLLNNLKVQERQNRVCTAIAIAVVSEACGPFTTIPAMMNEYRVPEQNVQNGILKSLSFIFEYVGEMAKDYIYTLLPLLEDALTDRDIVHRQTAACVVKHISVSVAGLGCEDALVHLLNYVWPNIFEENPHLRNAVMGAVEGIKLGIGPGNVLLYVLQGLYHPARRIRDMYWTFYNMLYQSSQDSLNAFLPNLNNDAENCYTRHELFYVM